MDQVIFNTFKQNVDRDSALSATNAKKIQSTSLHAHAEYISAESNDLFTGISVCWLYVCVRFLGLCLTQQHFAKRNNDKQTVWLVIKSEQTDNG